MGQSAAGDIVHADGNQAFYIFPGYVSGTCLLSTSKMGEPEKLIFPSHMAIRASTLRTARKDLESMVEE